VCGGLSVCGESWQLEWREGITQVAAYTRLVWYHCCDGVGEDGVCLSGEVGGECWGTEVQVLL